ncbi:FprA family A-type flavoprotein [Methanocella sp. CWC-04]|uniref:FprA family A-type flavoprotein n=1 Tax=Methanooceanicella nereidis TaxID=2052831 RepID=A0AAP2RDD4_9EURY|nr:flavodoxin domain-containing protein [Methanocella sp. CWC-04]MCD1294152.1 FprA family A-type flavoprotein [Methanocella sp. CWC-04]
MAKFVLLYLSMSGNTKAIADAVIDGARSEDVDVIAMDLCDARIEDIVAANAIGIGSPTYDHNMMAPVERLLDRLGKEDVTGKYGVAFGSYGWTGEAPVLIAERMRKIGIKVVDPVIRIQYGPSEKEADGCRLLGKDVALKIKRSKTLIHA